jgi:two-component system chemotaxis response regulator CheY
MKALIADDSNLIRHFLRKVLEPEGIEVTEAVDGTDALKALQTGGPVDVALLDWKMPGMDGLDVLEIVRADHKFDDMRVVMVTTETDMSSVAHAMDSGANEYIMKPFSKDVVLEKLRLLHLNQGPAAGPRSGA